MHLGLRIRALRKAKKIPARVIQERTGLHGPHLSRVENGHCLPSFKTLQRLAVALDCPLHEIFYDVNLPHIPKVKRTRKGVWGNSGREARYLYRLRNLLSMLSDEDRKVVMSLVRKMADG